jgi:cytidylate kinase
MGRSTVCISHTQGSGGEEIGRLVAERLGFLYVDEEVIARAAAKAGADVERIADEEKRKPLFSGLLDYLHDSSNVGLTPAPVWVDNLSAEEVRGFIQEAIHEIAERGGAVIVAHAASFAVGSDMRTLRLLVTAPAETRAQRLSAAGGVTVDEAAKDVRHSDSNRTDYLKRFYGVTEEPIHYDLVINTDTVSYERAVELVAQAVADEPLHQR